MDTLFLGLFDTDMTRTIAVGEISDKQKDIYDIVLKAQLNALKNIKSGVKCSFVDKCARDIITNEGYSQCFGHSTGHGVGLDIHEYPTVGPNSDTLLTENMVITVEPGIYRVWRHAPLENCRPGIPSQDRQSCWLQRSPEH